MSVIGINEVKQYLTFSLDTELFAVDVARVREVLDNTTITKIPRTPEYMRGVLNLRGSVIPVFDLRLKFGMTKTVNSRNTCIIVLEIKLEDEVLIWGALADAVQEVFEFEPDQIDPAPKFGTQLKTEFLKGIGKRKDKFIMILDIDRVFETEELIVVKESELSECETVEVI